MGLALHGYFRSTASWRVRIALRLKGLTYRTITHHLRKGEHRSPDYLRLNPQGLLPALELGGSAVLTQSLAICEYLEEVHPQPRLLPQAPVDRARVRAFAQIIACDVHPMQNLKILQRLRSIGVEEPAVGRWARWTIDEGLGACAALVEPGGSAFCFGEQPTLADICLIPQLANARRFGVELRWPRLLEIESRCATLPAFLDSAPERQPDAE